MSHSAGTAETLSFVGGCCRIEGKESSSTFKADESWELERLTLGVFETSDERVVVAWNRTRVEIGVWCGAELLDETRLIFGCCCSSCRTLQPSPYVGPERVTFLPEGRRRIEPNAPMKGSKRSGRWQRLIVSNICNDYFMRRGAFAKEFRFPVC